MRPDMIGERWHARIGNAYTSVTLLAWHANATATILLADGRAVQLPIEQLRRGPRFSQSDELRAEADAVLELIDKGMKEGSLQPNHIAMERIGRLRKALEQ